MPDGSLTISLWQADFVPVKYQGRDDIATMTGSLYRGMIACPLPLESEFR
jgi:hypothetical protein